LDADKAAKKFENFEAAVALHIAYYNFVRIHKSLLVMPGFVAVLETTPVDSAEKAVKIAIAATGK